MTGTTLDNIFNSKPASFIDLAVLVSISRHGNARYGRVIVMIRSSCCWLEAVCLGASGERR